ncbi:MAG: hypothetical protein WC916_02600 [Candidatus Woesearchaeota archaeon]
MPSCLTRTIMGIFLISASVYLLKNYDFSYTNSSINAKSRKSDTVLNHNFKEHRSEIRASENGLEGKLGYNHKNNQTSGQMNWREYTFAALFDNRYKTFEGSAKYTPSDV